MAPQVSQQEQEAKQDVELRVMAFARGSSTSPEYQAFMQANDALQQDQEAREPVAAVPAQDGRRCSVRGFDAATLDELKALQVRVKENATLTAFYTTQAALVALLEADQRPDQREDRPAVRPGAAGGVLLRWRPTTPM